MAKPAHTKHITITRASMSKQKSYKDDGEEYRLRRQIDQRLSDLRLERELREVWQT